MQTEDSESQALRERRTGLRCCVRPAQSEIKVIINWSLTVKWCLNSTKKHASNRVGTIIEQIIANLGKYLGKYWYRGHRSKLRDNPRKTTKQFGI